jgi:hypothetical protein
MAVTGARIIGIERIEKAIIQAFEDWTKEEINGNFWEKEFTRADWKYDSDVATIRRNPSAPIREAGNPRDIYDYGNLLDSGIKSYKYESSVNGVSAHWHWDAKNSSGNEYASYVHEGTRFMPDRPFTDKVSDAKFSFMSDIGLNLLDRVQAKLTALNAN